MLGECILPSSSFTNSTGSMQVVTRAHRKQLPQCYVSERCSAVSCGKMQTCSFYCSALEGTAFHCTALLCREMNEVSQKNAHITAAYWPWSDSSLHPNTEHCSMQCCVNKSLRFWSVFFRYYLARNKWNM